MNMQPAIPVSLIVRNAFRVPKAASRHQDAIRKAMIASRAPAMLPPGEYVAAPPSPPSERKINRTHRRWVTPERIAEVQALAEKGMSIGEAADALGCTYAVVNSLANRYGVKFRLARRSSLTPERVATLTVLAAEGMTKAEAARQCGLDDKTVSRLARDFGIRFVAHYGRRQ